MKISSETVGRLLASGRNYVSLVLGFTAGIGIFSAAQDKGLSDAFNEIFNGLSMVFHGATSAWTILAVVLGPIVGPLIARWASSTATTESQAAAVQAAAKDPNSVVSQVAKAAILDAVAETAPLAKPIEVADPALANMVPSPKVVASGPVVGMNKIAG